MSLQTLSWNRTGICRRPIYLSYAVMSMLSMLVPFSRDLEPPAIPVRFTWVTHGQNILLALIFNISIKDLRHRVLKGCIGES